MKLRIYNGIDYEIEYIGGKVTINGKKDLEYGDEETKIVFNYL